MKTVDKSDESSLIKDSKESIIEIEKNNLKIQRKILEKRLFILWLCISIIL